MGGDDAAMEGGEHIPHQQGGEEGTDEHREHTAHYDPETMDESEALLGIYEGHDGGDEEGGEDVDEDGIGDYSLNGAADFLRYDGCCRGCGADETDHSALKDPH